MRGAHSLIVVDLRFVVDGGLNDVLVVVDVVRNATGAESRSGTHIQFHPNVDKSPQAYIP